MSQPSTPEADVVIVVHNAGELLRPVVNSAVAQAGMDQVWVMDAESTDGSASAIAGSISPGHLRAVPNQGFSAANNRAIEITNSPFVLLLNPDAVLREGALAALLESAARNPRAGIIGPAVLNPDGSAQAYSWGHFPSLVSFLWLRVWRFGKRLRGNKQLSPRIFEHTTPVDWVTGACMLVRRSAIEAAGPMDEQFFIYWEDTEWCHRMHDHGWQVLVEPAAEVVHYRGVSAAPVGFVAQAYRDSLDHYCDLYGLWGLRAATRLLRAVRHVMGRDR
ncbi:MAG: glycosyltransferase family 2 protein [Coriobacteriia bacterium]